MEKKTEEAVVVVDSTPNTLDLMKETAIKAALGAVVYVVATELSAYLMKKSIARATARRAAKANSETAES